MSKERMNEGFTIDDIHKIREVNYEYTKDMTVVEKIAYYNDRGTKATEEIKKKEIIPVICLNSLFWQHSANK